MWNKIWVSQTGHRWQYNTPHALYMPTTASIQIHTLRICNTWFCRRGTAVAQWLRCCVTNRMVAGSIPAVSGFFIDIKSFRSHHGPGVDSASNINEYREYFVGVKTAVRLTTYHHPAPLSRNLGTLTSWNPLGLFRPLTGLLYLYLCFCTAEMVAGTRLNVYSLVSLLELSVDFSLT